MPTTRTAACTCGQLHLTAEGDPIRISICHCLNCQRRSGSAFAIQARFPRDKVRIEGRASDFVLTGDSGTRATFHFCPECGATVYYDMEGITDAVAIPVGAFADPTFPPPRISVYEERQHPWVKVTAEVEHFG